MTAPFPTAHALLERYGLRAKKSFGQNFLTSERAYRAIVDATVDTDADWIVEIGAGLGTLTMRLAERVTAGKVVAIEADRDMVTVLESELAHLDNVELVQADALRYDISTVARWAAGSPLTLCGNLPYNISTPLLFHLLDARAHWRRGVFMLQREVADRLLAKPGNKTYGALGVMVSAYAEVTKVCAVPRGAFVPPPKVESTVVRLSPRPHPRAAIGDPESFRRTVQAAFGQRRKTLRNALRAQFDPTAVDAALAAATIDPARRAETLAIEEFAALADAIAGADA